jgi:hypothetical protein
MSKLNCMHNYAHTDCAAADVMMGYSRWDTETFRMPNSVHNVIINECNRNSLSGWLAGRPGYGNHRL